MAIPGNANLLLLQSAAGAPTGYTIDRSVRFNSADTAYLSKTFGSAGNRKTWTWAGWVKRASLSTGNDQFLFSGGTTNSNTGFMALYFDSNHKLSLGTATTNILITDAVYRDVSAWMHVVFAFDATAGTDAAKAKIYVNGSEITAFGTDNRSGVSNQDYGINQAALHEIARNCFNSARYFDGYLADIHFIDGQALDPTDFGEFDDNGVWQPIEYAGTYGTNGFHLDFADNSSAAALGYDAAGSNDWTVNNISASSTPNYADGLFTNLSATGTTLNPSNAFNGDTTGDGFVLVEANNGGTSTAGFTFSPALTGTTIEAYFLTGNVSYAACSWAVDTGSGFGSENTLSSFVDGWVNLGVTTLEGLRMRVEWLSTKDSGMQLKAIRVDGTILISNLEADSLRDSPTNGDTANDTGAGGEVPGNYATANPLDKTNATLTNGNLDVEVSSAGTNYANGTIAVSSGKWYFEVTAQSGTNNAIGVADITGTPGFETSGSYVYFQSTGDLWFTSASSYGASWQTAGDVIGVALDMDTPSLVFYKNGVSQGTAITSWLSGKTIVPCFTCGGGSGNKVTANFGQRAFAYSAPSGYKALCTANLDDPTIADGSTAMDVALYTGNGSSQTISGLGFSPDFVWVKSRSNTVEHAVADTVRGATNTLFPNNTNAEATNNAGDLQSFTSDGFTISSNARYNELNWTYAAWTWDGGSSTVSNTDGSITSSVRANASAGFSVVAWTSTSGVAHTFGHGLGVAPHFVIVKKRSTGNWRVGHNSLGWTTALELNTTGAAFSADGAYWSNTAPTSTVITIGDTGQIGGDNIAYCFAPVEGYSAFGSYTGNGSADGPFVYTGFRPRWILWKKTNTSADAPWVISDTARSSYNLVRDYLLPNDSSAEATTDLFDVLSNGFKWRGAPPGGNYSGHTYVWVAFAESPFKYARAR